MKKSLFLKIALACALSLLTLVSFCALAEEPAGEAEKAACKHTAMWIWEEYDSSLDKYEYIDRATHRYSYTIIRRHLYCDDCGKKLQTIAADTTVSLTTYHWWDNWETPAENILYCSDCEATIQVAWPCRHHQLSFGEDANAYCPECGATVVLNTLQSNCNHSNRTVFYPNKAFTEYTRWDSKQHLKTTRYYIYEDPDWGIDAECNDCYIWIVCDLKGNIDYCGNTDRMSWESDFTSAMENHTFRNGVCACGEKQLAVLKLSADLKVIEDRAFFGDTSLQRVEVSKNTVSIGSKAFANSGVKEISLPASVTYIANDAFDGCKNLIIEAAPGTHAYDWAAGKGFTVR